MSYKELRERVNDLRKQADSCGACDGNGSWREYGCKIMCACCEGIREELESLEDQLAIERNAELERNRPKWTEESPASAGWYWVRYRQDARIAHVEVGSDDRLWMKSPGEQFGHSVDGFCGEWWPVPLEPPPSQITPPISDKGDAAQ